MSLASAVQVGPKPNTYLSRGCGFGRWARSLPPGEREAVEQMLAPNSGWQHSAIATIIREDDDYPGIEFRAEAIAYHRNAECSCEPR